MMYLQSLARELQREVGTDHVPDIGAEELFLLYALVAQIKGPATELRDVHDAWALWKVFMHKADHVALVPFHDLSTEVQLLDQPFADAIRAVSNRRTQSGRSGLTRRSEL
jgi:hypothetical protein